MKIARTRTASCFLASYLYVFCGDHHGNKRKAVERLKIEASEDRQMEQAWQLICLKSKTILSPRTRPVACPLNDSQILIMGGYDSGRFKNDAFVLDTGT